jgi:histidine triad (HIT) family protein
MEECIFCKIIAGEVPCAELVETDTVCSFLDIGPVNPGHSLVVPKRHVQTIVELSEEEVSACARVARRLAAAVMSATGSAGCNLLQNNDSCAGQLVPHVHFHVIPRSPDDGFRFGWRSGEYAEGEMEQMARSIKDRL